MGTLYEMSQGSRAGRTSDNIVCEARQMESEISMQYVKLEDTELERKAEAAGASDELA
jgi:hypothetical protein